MDIEVFLVPFDGPSNSRLTFNLFLFADEKEGNALTQPRYHYVLKGSTFQALFNNGSQKKILQNLKS